MSFEKFASIIAVLTLSFEIAIAKDRMILEMPDSEGLSEKVQLFGGELVGQKGANEWVVARISKSDLNRLKLRYPDLRAFEDIRMYADHSAYEPFAKKASAVDLEGRDQITNLPQQIPWGISAIKAIQAHKITRGAGIQVCVVDTGIDKNHPDLVDNVVGGRNFVPIRRRVKASAWDDDDGHGTHVAGIIAALDNSFGVVGVAPEADLYAVKVLDSSGRGYMSDVAKGVIECVRAGSHVINMSLGGSADPSKDSPLKRAVEYAIKSGVAVIVAAGNGGGDIKESIPAGFKGTIAVAAVNSYFQFPQWSNYGLSVDDLTGPGVLVYSTWKSGEYANSSGTSMAAPHVAGVVALKLSQLQLEFQSRDYNPSIAARSLGNRPLPKIIAVDLGGPVARQGAGFVDALATLTKF